jgi:hypothetical protein
VHWNGEVYVSEIESFHQQLMADVIAEVQGSGGGSSDGKSSTFKEDAFTRIVMEDLEIAGVLESPVACYLGNMSARQPYRINGYGFSDDETRLDLLITDLHDESTVQKLNAADVDRCFRQALRFLELALDRGPDILDPGHVLEHGMLREIHDKKAQFDRVQVILVTNALNVQRKEKARREQVGEHQVVHDIWDLERLRRFRSSGSTHEPIVVDFSDLAGGGICCVPVSDEHLGYKTCVAIFPGEVLYRLYDEYGARLLELNVRSYLQAKGKVNREILETLLQRPQQFLAYNNGITVVGERIEVCDDGGLITSIQGLQIVNGGQTTASIHRARKEHSADLTHVFVQAKITEVPSDQFETMVPEISRLSNTQNKVSVVDLGANHAYHVGIERVARRTWVPGEQSMWFYERARGTYQTERNRSGGKGAKCAAFDRKFPVSQRITKEDLARYGNTWLRLPHLVSKGGQKNFERYMTSVGKRDKGWEPTQEEYKTIIGQAILFKQAQECAKRLGIRAYGINVVTYTIALLSEKTFGRVNMSKLWDRQALTPALRDQISAWLPRVAQLIVKSAEDRNVGEWFKTEGCWAHLRHDASAWEVSAELAAELVPVDVATESSPVGVQNSIARCLQTDAQTWMQIQVWGNEMNSLAFWQQGIVNTLGGYAAQGWSRKPSAKQAAQAVKILELFEQSKSLTDV